MIFDLFATYAVWLLTGGIYVWLASVLYRTTRNTLRAGQDTAPMSAVQFPPRPARTPSIHLTAA